MFWRPLHSFAFCTTIYTTQNGRAVQCSIESTRKCFNQPWDTALDSPHHNQLAHDVGTNTICTLVPKWLSYKSVQITGLAGGKPTCVLFSLGVIREVPNQAKTNWSRPLQGPQFDKLISVPRTRNQPVLSQDGNHVVVSVCNANEWACWSLFHRAVDSVT